MKSIFTNQGKEIQYLPTSMYNKIDRSELYTAITMGFILFIALASIYLSI